jgi:O-antigen ligase
VLVLLAMLRRGRTVLGVAAGALLLSVFLLSAGTGVWHRFVSTFNPVANISRSFIWQANVDMARERPLLGWGYGNYKKFRDSYYQRYSQANTSAHAHNNFLQMWVEAGLFGLAAFLGLFVVILRKGWQTYRHAQEPTKTLALGLVLAVVGFLIGGLTQYNFGDAEVVLVLWATAGMGLRLYHWEMNAESTAVS